MPVLFWMGIEGWGTKEEVSRSGGGGRGPEVCGASAGGDLGDGRSAGGLEGAECVVELAGGLVVFEGVADLAAGQSGRVGLQRGVDLFGERLTGRAVQGPGGGAGGVVVERERGGEVLWPDLSLSEPVPALEGLSPRQAAAKGAYLRQLRSLLRGMESYSSKMGGPESYPIDLDAVVAQLGIGP
jgi:hypothetical protein